MLHIRIISALSSGRSRRIINANRPPSNASTRPVIISGVVVSNLLNLPTHQPVAISEAVYESCRSLH